VPDNLREAWPDVTFAAPATPREPGRVLLSLCLGVAGVAEGELGKYGLEVPKSKSSWRWGPVNLEDRVGDTGLVNLAQVDRCGAESVAPNRIPTCPICQGLDRCFWPQQENLLLDSSSHPFFSFHSN
jgi:hypothetical protein